MEKRKLYDLSLFIFRRDLRLIDNTGLIAASRNSKNVIPAFFLDKRQVEKNLNPYFSSNSVQFMCECLSDMNNDLQNEGSHLYIFHGDLMENLEKLIKSVKIQSIYLNKDYTPFSVKRDKEIEEFCNKNKIVYNELEDILLTDLHSVKTKTGTFSKVYTPYYRAANQTKMRAVDESPIRNFITTKENKDVLKHIKHDVDYEDENDLYKILQLTYNKHTEIKGGRKEGEKKLSNLKVFKDYSNTRNFPIIPSTRLSAYLKFGVVSAREVYHIVKSNFGKEHDLIKQLHWRDFYTKISYFYPHVIGKAMKENLDVVKWESTTEHIEAWKNGETGCPIVDAAMKCLNQTGFMHNRLRMIVGSFLVKDLIADWKEGEKYFANKLIDYDTSLNNGGWQWVASTGTDSQPYFRIFNPSLQSEKFDKNCEFIKKWLPQLKNVPSDHLHFWEKNYSKYKGKLNYPEPIIVHDEQKQKVIKLFKMYSNKDDEDNTPSNTEVATKSTNKKRKADNKDIEDFIIKKKKK
jgi:deoxyribodipyrimidine photo-lyase